MLVFRDPKRLKRRKELELELERLSETRRKEPLGALLFAAEVECALEDVKHASAARARELTDALAEAWLEPARPVAERVQRCRGFALPAELWLKVPEGYAFYALDPRGYADAAVTAVSGAQPVCVIGVRSIGSSLSAITRASLALAGIPAARITVRPGGHPWDRRLDLDEPQRELVLRDVDRVEFLIVDEGPGMSGSTLLAVSDALTACGVRTSSIRFLTSHAIEPQRLRARAAAERFAPFGTAVARPWCRPEGTLDFSGGAWRAHARFRHAVPPVWPLQERAKYVDPATGLLHKFCGLAHHGDAVYQRAAVLAGVGKAPRVHSAMDGFLTYPWLPARCADVGDRRDMLRPIAEYVALRSRALTTTRACTPELRAMTELNVLEASKFELPRELELEVRSAVIPDGRMLPHEWIFTAEGQLVKTDGAEHGDDHFFPGPTDVAWDLAGAIVEWDLDLCERSALLRYFESLTGDRIARRVRSYEVAYAAFRLGVVSFAAGDSNDEEARRFRRAGARYRRRLQASLLAFGRHARRQAPP